jgi:membrane protease YdiL (CAAX protease family)
LALGRAVSRDRMMRMALRVFIGSDGRLRGGWWIAIFLLVLLATLLPLILMAQGAERGVPVWHQAGAILVASVLCQLMRRKPLGELFGGFGLRWLTHLGIGAVIGVLLMAVPALALLLLGAATWQVAPDGYAGLVPALALFTAVALTEELMFRGFVFQRLIEGLGPWPAQLIASFFFVLTHSAALQTAGPLGALAGANIFIASLMFGFAYLRTRSLAMPIGIHLMANFMQGGVLGFGVSGAEETGLLAPTLSGPDWLTGAAFGLEASAPGLVCVAITTIALWLWRRRGAPRGRGS